MKFTCFRRLAKGMICILFVISLASCAVLAPTHGPWDAAAEQSLVRVQNANQGLERLKCIVTISLAGPGQPVKRFRAAIAGQFNENLRIDLFSPFGGSAGTFSADGDHLFLVTHPSRKYYKKRFGSGSLHRFVQLDVSVAELLNLLAGRIPVREFFTLRYAPHEGDAGQRLILLDRWGNIEQKIFLDTTGKAFRGEWLDMEGELTHSMSLIGEQRIDAYDLPRKIELSDKEGHRATIVVEKYIVNAEIDETIFTLQPPVS